MILRNLSEFLPLLRPKQCLLGLDYGRKVIGVAVSDPNLHIASPLATLTRKKLIDDIAALLGFIKERNVGGLVVGLPKNMDGSEGGTSQAVQAFVQNLLQKGDLPSPGMPVLLWDERFSTAAVERFMIEDDMSRNRREKVIDKAAAAYILQGALDARQNKLSQSR